MPVNVKRIELLAPARDYDSAVAAIDAGADAVYIGGARFGARRDAGNSTAEIARVVEYAHLFGVRVHATLNTLLYDDELRDAGRQARELVDAGVDALIVQDMALRRMDLPVELHASTQMHTMTPADALFLERCGFARVILERALSLEEIRAVCAATRAEVECFVHGALCVGYSGRCFLSRSMGPRSGNRGACSQPCRLPWDLVAGDGRRLVTGRHLLSLRDLNLSARIGELLDAGVVSFKIEGRLKDTNYIRNVVTWYRRAVDEALAVRPGLVRASAGESTPDFEPDPAKSFTRGESEYYFSGRCRGVASFDTPKSVGEFVGRVAATGRGGFLLDRPHALAAGDGICFGGRGTRVNLVEGSRIVPDRMEGIVVGCDIYRNYDRLFNQALERSRMRRTLAVRAACEVSEDRVSVRYTDDEGVAAEAVSEGRFEAADDPLRMADTIRTQLTKSGGTPFVVTAVEAIDGRRFVPASLLAALRREALERLRAMRVARPLPHRILAEERTARFPRQELTAQDNVTNRLAAAFYRDHGVRRIERGLDLADSTAGRCVMRTAYCLRRELGACLREGTQLRGPLYLEHGAFRYRLEFDCGRCEMALVDESRPAEMRADGPTAGTREKRRRCKRN